MAALAVIGSSVLYAADARWPAGLPIYDHIVIVIEENKNYEEVIGSQAAPFINQVLKAEGANLTQMYGEEHHSQGNYFWLFSGSNQNTCCSDVTPKLPINARNLGEQLIGKGLSFKGYAEDLPEIGATVEFRRPYARKHVPWISFANVPNGKTIADSSNLRFSDFPSDFSALPTVAIVVPNLLNDMHDPSWPSSIARGDAWLRQHIEPYYQWAKTHNSLLIVTFDESNEGDSGLTDPAASRSEHRNRIVTLLAGARIKAGDYPEGRGVTHVNLLRTIEAMYGLQKSGAQQPYASRAGISDLFFLTDVFSAAP